MDEKFVETKTKLFEAHKAMDELIQHVQVKQDELRQMIDELSEPLIFNVDEDALKDFMDEPYLIFPKKKEEWYVIVPKFIPFNIGWLERSSATYNIFLVNKYASWLGDIPQVLRSKFKFKPPLPLQVINGFLHSPKMYQGEAKARYGEHLLKRKDDERIYIKKGREFQLIAQMVEDGILPFALNPVEQADIRPGSTGVLFRVYQEKAWNRFCETGAVGIFWPFGTGKTFFGVQMCDRLTGDKLVVVPSLTIKEQWEKYIEKMDWLRRREVEITTYQSLRKVMTKKNEYTLVLFDECHTLPAKTYAKGSTIKAKYRVGFSSTPYREDGKTHFIFALTGFPVGLDWNDMVALGYIKPPDIYLYIVSNKAAKLERLLREPKKTIIFCDSIEKGKSLSKREGIPFVYGDSKDRLKTIEENDVVVVSRVGDEGISIPSIERVIEYDFLYGSRRQEGQRMGRVMHGRKKGEHIILMTPTEYHSYSKRLDAIYAKGFKIKEIQEAE